MFFPSLGKREKTLTDHEEPHGSCWLRRKFFIKKAISNTLIGHMKTLSVECIDILSKHKEKAQSNRPHLKK